MVKYKARMHTISYDFNIIGWQQLQYELKVLETYIQLFVHVNTHDQKNFWFGLSHAKYLNDSIILQDFVLIFQSRSFNKNELCRLWQRFMV